MRRAARGNRDACISWLVGSRGDDGGAQGGHALDRAVDDVAGLQVEVLRIGLAHGDPAGRAGGEHVARLDRDEAREVLEDVGDLSLIHISEPTRQAEISY